MTLVHELAAQFTRRFGKRPRMFRAPGRVNVIGEHTDYNDGFVLPAALELATYAAIATRGDRRLRVASLGFAETVEIDLDDPEADARGHWSAYVTGVVRVLQRAGHGLVGADMLIGGDLPVGAGLSSSAALEVVVGYAMLDMAGIPVDLRALAGWCRSAENDVVGLRCGIMDQLISCHGIAGHAVLIDCRSLEMRPVKIDPSVTLVVCDTMVRHELARGAYNIRRNECEDGVALLSARLGEIAALRDVTAAELERHAELLPEPVLRRCRHVVGENARVLAAVAALETGDLALCGRLMSQSHRSLRDDFAVSCAELDLMVALADHVPGVLGSRMTGGGFGGSIVSLVETPAVDRFTESIGRAYADATGRRASIFACTPGSGVGPVRIRGHSETDAADRAIDH